MTVTIGQWVELTEYGTAKVVNIWRDGKFDVRLGSGIKLVALTAKDIRPAAAAATTTDILTRIEAL